MADLEPLVRDKLESNTIGFEPSLEGLRGIAAIVVVGSHLSMVTVTTYFRAVTWFPGSIIFMDMFFVLSGFLITSLLLKEQLRTGRVNLFAFYKRRALRLLPALWAMLLVYFVFATLIGYSKLGGWDLIRPSITYAAFYGLNFRMVSLFSPVSTGLTHLWSLGLEEQFYLVWPLFVILVIPLRRRLGLTLAILTSLILAIWVYRYNLAVSGASTMRIYTHPDTRADSFMIGGLIAYLWIYDKLPSARVLKIGAWCATVAMTIYLLKGTELSPFNAKYGYSISAVSFAIIILAAAHTNWVGGRLLSTRPIRLVGRSAYSIYLWHVPVLIAVHFLIPSWPSWLRVVVAIIITGIASALSWKYIEQPFLKLKNRTPRPEAAS